jgi:hypothetical protein
MNSTERRVHKLYPQLSAPERVKLLLQAAKAQTPLDPLIRETMPAYQQQQFNALLGDVRIANRELGSLATLLFHHARGLALTLLWTVDRVGHAATLADVRDGLDARSAKKIAAALAGAERVGLPLDLDRPLSEDASPLAREVWQVFKGLRDEAVEVALQAHTMDAYFEAFSEKIGGEDPLRPEARQMLDDAVKIVTDVLLELGRWVGPVDLPDDRLEEYCARIEEIVDEARAR